MTIYVDPSKMHWNYYLALEHDMEVVSRYVEFCEPNFSVYSIELAHLLFAAASEVDVVAKLLCSELAPDARRKNIDDYRRVIVPNVHGLTNTVVRVPRFGLHFRPWERWAGDENPLWWASYNNVKHERNVHFSEATLKNALNALGALQILTFHLHWLSLKSMRSAIPY